METRACRAEELEALAALVNRVFRAGDGDMRTQYPLLFGPDNLAGLRIVPGDPMPHAHVGVCVREATLLGARLRVASIGAVCTDPDHRGQGLASALMADALRHARNMGAALLLISGGRGLYHRLGYVTVGRFDRYRLDAPALHAPGTSAFEVTRYQAEDLPGIAALHQAEPVRFFRPAADWHRLLQAGMLMNAPADLLVIRSQGQLIAYAGAQRPRPDARGEMGPVRIREMAGARSALVRALPSILDQFGAASVELIAQPSDIALAAEARLRGWIPVPQSFPGTVGVIDPAALMDALRPVLLERAAETADLRVTATEAGVSFALNGERYDVAGPGPLAALLFGGDTEEAKAVPLPEGALSRLLSALFPVPLLWSGYNYV